MASIEEVKESVLEGLPELSEKQLEDMVTGLALNVKEPKGGKGSRRSLLLNTMRRYISSEDLEDMDDQGLETLDKLYLDMEALIREKRNAETEIKESILKNTEDQLASIKNQVRDEAAGDSTHALTVAKEALEKIRDKENWNRERDVTTSSQNSVLHELLKKMNEEEEAASKSQPNLEEESRELLELLRQKVESQSRSSDSKFAGNDVHRFKIKEFKINGSIGGENEMEFSSLMFQVKEGRTLGYSEKEIQIGIVKVVKDKTLKKFLEINTDMTGEDFYGLIRNHYDVKDSTTLLEEMVASVQEPTENLVKFVMRMMNTKNTIMEVTKCEECPLGDSLIHKQFVRSLLVGLRKSTNRIELQPIFERKDLSELQILKLVKEIMKKDEENEKKMGKKGDVKALDVELEKLAARRKDSKVVEDAVLEQVSNLTAQVQGLLEMMNLMKEEMKELKKTCVKQNDSQKEENYNSGKGGKRFSMKCKDCERKRLFCTHCSLCGSGDHKRKDCEKNE